LRVVFMGTPEFSVPSLERLVFSEYQVVAVYTQPDRPSGRGRVMALSPLKRAAESLNLPVVQPPSLKKAEAIEQLARFQPDVIVVAAFGQILPRSVLDIPTYGCIAIHPSLLPKYRGTSPVAAAILAGDEFTGVSIILIEEKVDSGPILMRAQISISNHDTTGSLTDKLSLVSAHLLHEVLVHWLRAELVARHQSEAQATYTKLIAKEEGEIDWRLPAVDIWRRVRAFQPWPGCYTRWQGKQLKIIKAVPLPQTGEGSNEAGQVVELPPTACHPEVLFGVHTGSGILGVSQVQLEGRRAMSGAEFVRGQRRLIGAVLAHG